MFKWLLFVVFFVSPIFFSVQSLAQGKHLVAPPVKIDYSLIGSPMPDLVLATYDTFEKKVDRKGVVFSRLLKGKREIVKSNILTSKDLVYNGNLFVMMFNPNCSHCIEMTELLKSNAALFSKYKIVLMANSKMKDYLPDFIKQRKTKDFPIFCVGLDSSNFINETFLYRSLPQINIYDKKRTLIKVYNGDISIDSLKIYLY